MRTLTILSTILMTWTAAMCQDVRYTDDVNGFSLIPPVGSIQTRVDEASVLAQWIKVDPKTGNTEWAFSVSRQVAEVRNTLGEKLKDSEYAALKISSFTESILSDVQNQPEVKVLSKQEQTIAARQAIVVECAGQVAANLPAEKSAENQRWMKQAWIRVTPRMFLTFKIVAREKFKKRAQTVWQAIMDTLKITDDKAGSVRQQEKAINAEKILDMVVKEKLLGMFSTAAQWFLISRDNIVVGWLCMGAKPQIFLETRGYELRSYAEIRIPGQPVKLVYQQMFTSEDLKTEQWRLWMQSGDGAEAKLFAEDGLMQDNHILCETNASGQSPNKQVMDLPTLAVNMYLPKAAGTVIATRLACVGGSGYIFAEYDSARNNLAMRELTVAGPEELSTDTGPIKAVKIVETSDRTALPTLYWVSPEGKILKIQNPAGMVMTSASREMVLQNFPNATAMIDAIRNASQKKWKEGNQ
ncbi:MAG TPA: hypothetical protein PKK48_08805 [Phycisphaerae bacterium]|nr:hypothetical protein [Phycisphaerae bacterium]